MTFPPLSSLSSLNREETLSLCEALRSLLVSSVSETGGHLASNLGIVEISVALLKTLSLPQDSVIYDTGHQSYVHKILTGRGEAFSTLRTLGGISGFPRREESPFDAFGTGHSGTGISAALGLATAKRLAGQEGWCVVVLGDGAFTGGMIFEALNNIHPKDKVIVILNDNGMSISKSVGRFKSTLNRMRTAGYYRFKSSFQGTVSRIPLVGEPIGKTAAGLKRAVKRFALPMGNFFEQLGLHYFGPADGNDVETVEFLLREAMREERPSVLHLCTKKGKGYAPAEENPSRFHGISPKNEKKDEGKSASRAFGEILCRLAEEDEKIVAITAAMEDGVGLGEFAERFPSRFFDVGIAEEHALTFGAALAAGGAKPVFAVYSTFYQRAVDQLLHDAALQRLPLVLALDRAGVSGEDGSTHHGLFDVALTLPIPGVRIVAPLGEAEMERQLRRAFAEKETPTLIRYAKGAFDEKLCALFPGEKDAEILLLGEEPRVTAVTYGRITSRVLRAAKAVAAAGIGVRVVRFATLKGFDEKILPEIFSSGDRLLFVEEGVEEGGFSRSLAARLYEAGIRAESRILAVGDAFVPHGPWEALLDEAGLSVETIGKEMINLAKTGSVSCS